MFVKYAVRLALVVLAAVPAAALAQSEPCARPTSVQGSLGISQNDRADAAINNTQYQGRGPQLSLGAAANVRGLCLEAFATGGAHYLRPLGGGFGSERVLDGRADLYLLKPVASSADPMPGLRVATWSSLRGGRGQVGYERALSRYLTGTLAYQASGLRYDDARPARVLSQMLTFGFRITRPTEHR